MPDGIVLVGLPGSGKSVVGRRIAGLLGRPFVDTDELIERSTGVTPADHIRADGEPAFRDLERRAVVEACAVPGAVIGAGGGAVLDPRNRWALMDHGLRVRLDAPIETLAGRLAGAAPPRPLLGADIRAGLERTADERSAVYAAVDAVVDASSDPATVAADVIDASLSGSWRTLYEGHYARHHPVGPEHGRVLMGRGIDRASLERALKAFAGRDAVTVADRRALEASPSLQAALPNRRLRAMDGGEASKSFAELERLLTWLSELGAERGDPLLVAGGGTLGDVGGLAAALHRRGMPLVQLPTTWLAQADSALGGKVAIDLPGAKNAVGAFWSPWLIVSDATLPCSQPIERRRDGIAECLKAGLIGDQALWALVEERGVPALSGEDPAAAYAMTERAARLKLAIVDRDPFEEGERRVLNLGHTLGHALEVESQYTLAHGEAVALGLRAVASIADHRGAERHLCDRIDAVLSKLGFPLQRSFDAAAVRQALTTDKKRRNGTQRWILPMAVGHVIEVSDVTDEELAAALGVINA